jgi:outer membrane lipase/esterase
MSAMQKTFLARLTILLFLLTVALVWAIRPGSAQVASAYHPGFGNAYFFGDSLTDCCWTQRYTNSMAPNWADLLPPLIGASYTASKQTDLAVAGAAVATSGGNPTLAAELGIQTSFLAQVGRLGNEGVKIRPDDIAGIWIGTNDIWPSSYSATDQAPPIVGAFDNPLGPQPSVAALTSYVISNLRTGIDQLKADGFHNIVLLSPYDIGQSAIEPNAAAAALATQYSISIRNAESHLYTPGVNTYFVDVLSLLQQVQANPAIYGFLHTTAVDNCQANNCDSLPLTQQNTYIFNDILHLTSGFDQVLANDAARIINAGITVPPCGD